MSYSLWTIFNIISDMSYILWTIFIIMWNMSLSEMKIPLKNELAIITTFIHSLFSICTSLGKDPGLQHLVLYHKQSCQNNFSSILYHWAITFEMIQPLFVVAWHVVVYCTSIFIVNYSAPVTGSLIYISFNHCLCAYLASRLCLLSAKVLKHHYL